MNRHGMTLVEVLVAIFVMGIGLIALLALFPIGILRMQQAIHDHKCASCVVNAQSIAQIHNVRNDLDVVSELPFPPYAYDPANPVGDLFVNPYPKNAAGVAQLPSADPFDASYPVMADPIGFLAAPTGSVSQHWVGSALGFLRRRPVEFARRAGVLQQNVLRNFSLWDDMSFQNGDPFAGAVPGTPTVLAPTAPPTIARDTRYSWAYVLRRPHSAERSVVDCSVLVFDKRPLGLTGTYTLAESVYANVTYFDPVKNTILIDYTGNPLGPPALRPGNWIMDATLYQRNPAGPTPYKPLVDALTPGSAHAFFYRVVSADDLIVAGRTFARYEVQQPIRGFVNLWTGGALLPTVNDPSDPTTGPPRQVFQGTAIVIEGIAEVFEMGPIRLP